jgi:hypothetical protein
VVQGTHLILDNNPKLQYYHLFKCGRENGMEGLREWKGNFSDPRDAKIDIFFIRGICRESHRMN